MSDVSAWRVETISRRLRRFGKLSEELGELQAVVARCIIQGIDEVDPSSGDMNRKRLEDEIADVLAQIECTLRDLSLNRARIESRRDFKIGRMIEWEYQLGEG
jgi:NTP pyrophosphatase (non-canonical NTP hydrolase)